LLAEDDDAVRDMITNILENKGYTVKSSSNGREALKTFMEHSDAFDLLLFDVAMPQLDGKDAYDEI
ncbi:MAG: response regulator, partial [Desulfobacterales bacterium]|nr:response regulator [Desulfobacterales bacterium]